MKNIFLFLLIMFASMSCTEQVDTSSKEHKINRPTLDVADWREEVLDIDSVRINGTLPVLSSKKDIIEFFGTPKNISKLPNEYGFLGYLSDSKNDGYRLSYDNIIFDGIQDTTILNTIFFTENESLQLIHPDFTLNHNTYARELKEIFPQSFKLITVSGNSWSGHVILHTTNISIDPRRWVLIFQNERLVKMSLHTFI